MQLNVNFFISFNCILSNSSNLCELVQLHLQQAYSLPILTHSIAAFSLSDKQLEDLNTSWNSVIYRRNFKFHRWESVKLFMYGLGNLDFKHILLKRSTKLYISMQLTNNLVVKQCLKFFKYSYGIIKFSWVSKWSENLRLSAVNSLVYDAFKLSV